ncbi:putative bromodomain-containing protein [Cucumis melo var. makuwa]|uniref:Bromodomain-containing protein n=2 Tax=Cucumis melo TaxID=3656 RepID=A0A5A7VM67_CUCMM|nr:putative bromodomain-containing protein [Cucumis melo var. makuwa]TYK00875.1 putative bromodomain-containing protein [Cucumis melo var. makuwa]
MPKKVGGSKKYIGKGSPDAVLGIGKNVGGTSSDRLYRAALLRNRFTDTILKVREKALEKGDKRDPEKVRMEREELERQQREGWWRATNGGTLKLKLRPRRGMSTMMERMATSYGRQRMFRSSPNPFPFVFSSV